MGLVWNDSLKTGIPEIDQQHKQLIEQMNLLSNAIEQNKEEAEIRKIINFLSSYVQQHFGFEEVCMQRYICPVAEQNQAAHSHFINTFKEIREDLKLKGATLILADKINENLLDWFGNHIRKIDTQLKPCMPGKK